MISVIGGFALLGERLPPAAVAGGLLIIGGVALRQLARAAPARPG